MTVGKENCSLLNLGSGISGFDKVSVRNEKKLKKFGFDAVGIGRLLS
jgi:hypothetical protein